MIVALVKPHLVEDLKEAVLRCGADGLTVSESRVCTPERTERRRGAEFSMEWTAVSRIEIAVKEEQAAAVLAAAARHGTAVPGSIICSVPLETAIRIRTEECGVPAL